METRDYLEWHEPYDRPGSRLHLRLLVVQDLVAQALDELPPGPIRCISMCAGQGRDLLTVARRHRRGADLHGVLVELDPRNVEIARREIAAHGLDGLRVVEADAAASDVYAEAAPADLVLACGIFGNITQDDVDRTIRWLPSICAPGAWALWTRHPQGDLIQHIRDVFDEAGFEEVSVVVPKDEAFGVGAARLVTPPRPFEPGLHLFDFRQ